jgi:biopolymer transport protein ExbD/biopolymer transport protein TolR
MAFEVASPGKGKKKGRSTPDMNVTPLVDVVLVLLIIFMVITPLLAKQFWVHVPERPDEAEPATTRSS